jgi:hypothetical protein
LWGVALHGSEITATFVLWHSRHSHSRTRTQAPQVYESTLQYYTVWWQALFYVSSFLLTWPIYFVANFDTKYPRDYAFWVAVAGYFQPTPGLLELRHLLSTPIGRTLEHISNQTEPGQE